MTNKEIAALKIRAECVWTGIWPEILKSARFPKGCFKDGDKVVLIAIRL